MRSPGTDCFSRSADDVKKRVEQEGRECLLVPADLMEDANCKKVVDEHVKKYGRIDVLVNNASKQIQCKDLGKSSFCVSLSDISLSGS